MKHEPRPVIHLEKQLGRAHKLCGAESLGISKVGQIVLAGLTESQMWHQLNGSAGGGFSKETMASPCLDARHLSFSMYTTGDF